MKYYLHDTSAVEDEKVSELFIKFGYEGVGLFYVILEKLAKQEKPIKTSVLKQQLRIGKRLEKCWGFIEKIGLITSNDGETFNTQLLHYSEKYQIKKEKTAKRVAEWREKQTQNTESLEELCANFEQTFSKVSLKFHESLEVFQKKINILISQGVDSSVITKLVTCYERVSNARKVKESKVKESKVNNIGGFIAPELVDVEQYFVEHGFSKELAKRFYEGYSVNSWMDSKGNKIKNWKQKAQMVWFKDENKIRGSTVNGKSVDKALETFNTGRQTTMDFIKNMKKNEEQSTY